MSYEFLLVHVQVLVVVIEDTSPVHFLAQEVCLVHALLLQRPLGVSSMTPKERLANDERGLGRTLVPVDAVLCYKKIKGPIRYRPVEGRGG